MTAILAAFDHRQLAARAMQRLADAGIPRDRMHCEHELEHLHARRPQPVGNDSVLGSFGRLFADLVQTNIDPRNADLISQAVQRGACVLAVQADASQADAAAAVMRACGAFNVSVQAGTAAPTTAPGAVAGTG